MTGCHLGAVWDHRILPLQGSLCATRTAMNWIHCHSGKSLWTTKWTWCSKMGQFCGRPLSRAMGEYSTMAWQEAQTNPRRWYRPNDTRPKPSLSVIGSRMDFELYNWDTKRFAHSVFRFPVHGMVGMELPPRATIFRSAIQGCSFICDQIGRKTRDSPTVGTPHHQGEEISCDNNQDHLCPPLRPPFHNSLFVGLAISRSLCLYIAVWIRAALWGRLLQCGSNRFTVDVPIQFWRRRRWVGVRRGRDAEIPFASFFSAAASGFNT